MSEGKTSISKASSYEEAGEYWDEHDLSDIWDQTEPVEFEIDIKSSRTYFAVEAGLSKRLRSSAKRRGVSAETLANLWLQERVLQEADVQEAGITETDAEDLREVDSAA